MSVESIESTARRVSFEMGVEAVKLVGPLSERLWAVSRFLVTKALKAAPGRGGSMGGRVSTVDLEKFPNGQLDGAWAGVDDERTTAMAAVGASLTASGWHRAGPWHDVSLSRATAIVTKARP